MDVVVGGRLPGQLYVMKGSLHIHSISYGGGGLKCLISDVA